MKQYFVMALLGSAAFAASAVDAQQLTEAQTEAAFTKADTGKDGTVSLAEAKKFGITTAAFHAANPDKDGTLDWKEAKKAGVKTKKTFDAANPDKDGTLDAVEFVNALTAQAR